MPPCDSRTSHRFSTNCLVPLVKDPMHWPPLRLWRTGHPVLQTKLLNLPRLRPTSQLSEILMVNLWSRNSSLKAATSKTATSGRMEMMRQKLPVTKMNRKIAKLSRHWNSRKNLLSLPKKVKNPSNAQHHRNLKLSAKESSM